MKRNFTLLIAILVGIVLQTAIYAYEGPNIIIIFNDDQGYQDLGCFGSPDIKTPRVDQLAAQGMILTDFYVASSVCSPSRAALLTGYYPHRTNVKNVLFPNNNNGLDTGYVTIAEVLKNAGYATAAIGKWHLGESAEFLPTNQGFDKYYGIPYSNDMFPSKDIPYADSCLFREGYSLETMNQIAAAETFRDHKNKVPLMRNGECVEFPCDQTTITRRYANESIEFITESVNNDVPFFLYLANTMPHIPLFSSPEFEGISDDGPYGDVIEEIDFNIGRIMDTLDALGLTDNTIVIVTSDNGPWLSVGEERSGNADPLFEGKFTSFEGGMRVPCVIRWPDSIPAGSVCSELTSSIDILPTLAYLTGAPLPESDLDGRNIIDLWTGKEGAVSPHDYYFFISRGLAVRSGKWKYHEKEFFHYKPTARDSEGPALYNLEEDIGESINLIDQYPEIADSLANALYDYLREIGLESEIPRDSVYIDLPGKVEAEAYITMEGIQLVDTQDEGGGRNVGYVDTGDWLDYLLNVKKTGKYLVDFRVASQSNGGLIELVDENGNSIVHIEVPVTNGWQAWTTITSDTFLLPNGTYSLRLLAGEGGFNINWMNFRLLSAEMVKAPNVIFIAIEDFNPAHMGCYGGQALTPNIDHLAQEGVIFRNASCDNPVCNPSRTALLTGLRPPTSGVFGNSDNWQELILPRIEATLPEHFKNKGYETAKIGKLYHLNMEHPASWTRELPEKVPGRTILSSWNSEVVPLLKVVENDPGTDWFNENLAWGPVNCDPGEFRDGHMATNVENYLAEEHANPFFLAVGFHAPHVKFAAPSQFFDLYDLNQIELPDNPPNDLDDIPSIKSKNTLHSIIDDLTWKDIKRAQFACMSYVDWCIGKVMESVRANKLDDNTIIVIWTDHGLMLGEHFQWGKGGNKLYNETTKVGCIWKVPGLTPGGVISNSMVETIDFFPTWFELCNIDPPLHVQGKSFAGLLEDPSMHGKKAGFSWGSEKRLSVQTERFRLNMDIDLDPSSFELYDHKVDPNEYINLRSDPLYADTIQQLISYYQEEFNDSKPVEGVSIFSCPNASLEAGSLYQMKASLIPIDAAEQRLNWRSSNTEVATVDAQGLVKAVSNGFAIIEAETMDGAYIDACEIEVLQSEISVYGVSLGDCPQYILETRSTYQLTANLAPVDATNQSVTWSSSNPEVASVDDNGLITGISQGTATITVRTNDGGFSSTCRVGVMSSGIAVTGVAISGCISEELAVGATLQLEANIIPEDANDQALSWSSSDNSVASVDQFGLVSAQAAGIATIRVSTNEGGYTDDCEVEAVQNIGTRIAESYLQGKITKVYPNPVNKMLHFDFSCNDMEKNISIYNTQGQILLSISTNKNHTKIDVSELSRMQFLIAEVRIGGNAEYFKLSMN